jgi:hypothetical protein
MLVLTLMPMLALLMWMPMPMPMAGLLMWMPMPTPMVVPLMQMRTPMTLGRLLFPVMLRSVSLRLMIA